MSLASNSEILKLEDLHAAYGARVALQGITCAIRPQRVTAVVGPSGSGKTTFCKVLNRTLELTPGARVTRGVVRFGDLEVYGPRCDPLTLRKKIGLIHQRPIPFAMSIAENVLFGVRFHGHWDGRAPNDVVRTHLEQAGLWEEVKDRLHEPATQLSQGQQQRLCIARTLANQPDVILMDEPCSSLDPRATAVIESLIGTLAEKLAIVVVTHNLAQARRIAHDALAIIDGRLVESGEAMRVLTDPSDPRVRDFICEQVGGA